MPRNEYPTTPPPASEGGPPATERQLSYLADLLKQRQVPDAAREAMNARIASGDISKFRASDFITRLKAQPHRVDEPTRVLDAKLRQGPGEWPEVPEGRYAIERDGVLKFYKVDRPDKGRWEGFTFLKSLRGGPHGEPAEGAIKRPDLKRSILEQIAEDPKAATMRYGVELGECGVCGRTLTDETSRAVGIGPVCRGERGW